MTVELTSASKCKRERFSIPKRIMLVIIPHRWSEQLLLVNNCGVLSIVAIYGSKAFPGYGAWPQIVFDLSIKFLV